MEFGVISITLGMQDVNSIILSYILKSSKMFFKALHKKHPLSYFYKSVLAKIIFLHFL
jgi:hypothetical protein